MIENRNDKSCYVGKYRFICVLGKGGSGTVYLAEDRILEKLWAIKVIPKNSKKQLQEALLMKNLDHPGLPRITEQIEDNKYYYLVMDYVDGETLYERCRKKPATAEEAADWGIQICDILEYLHDQKPPILYRDLKPGNLILTPSGKIKLVDFGIARQQYSKKVDAYGTRGFAAPEQYKGKATIQSDLYSLGACLRWCLQGRKVLGLERILRKCLQKNPKKRFTDSRKLRRKLKKLKSKWEKSKKERKILLVCLLAVLFLGIGEIVREGLEAYRNVIFIRLSGEKEITVNEVLLNGQRIPFRQAENGIYLSPGVFEEGNNKIQVEITDGEKVYYVNYPFDF